MDCCTPRTDYHGTTGFPTEDEHRKTGQRTTAAARCNGPYSSRSSDEIASPLWGIFWDICLVAVQGPPKKHPTRSVSDALASNDGQTVSQTAHPHDNRCVQYLTVRVQTPTWWLHQKAQTNQRATLPRGWIEGEGPAGPAWHQDIEMIPEIQGPSTPESQRSPALWCMTVSEQRRILSMIQPPTRSQAGSCTQCQAYWHMPVILFCSVVASRHTPSKLRLNWVSQTSSDARVIWHIPTP